MGENPLNGKIYLKDIVYFYIKKYKESIYLDESDYMVNEDFDSILAIAGERPGIRVMLSSTPTGARKRFWQACTDKKLGFKEFHFPSMCNPNWNIQMEEEFRAQLSAEGYVHEILAEFGTQETGVFDKDALDRAMQVHCYIYNPLTYSQELRVKESGIKVQNLMPPKDNQVFMPTPFRTMGVNTMALINRNIN